MPTQRFNLGNKLLYTATGLDMIKFGQNLPLLTSSMFTSNSWKFCVPWEFSVLTFAFN